MKFYNYLPKKDSEGDWAYCFWLLPSIEFSFSGSKYGDMKILIIQFLFWQLQIKL